MDSPQNDASPGETRVTTAIDRRLLSLDSVTHRRNNEYVLQLFAEWLATYRGVETVDSIGVIDCRRCS